MKNNTDEIAFPQFVTEREIKASDRSRVCLVRNRETGNRYIYRSFTGSGEVYHKLRGIDCPYLPKIHDIKEENGSVYVLEEYIQGDTLAFLLECKPLSQEYAGQILRQLCQGLQMLHGIGAVHRDIKPENIILRGSDAVLIDFDASRLCKAENTTDTQIMGTTGYAAPEQYGFSQTDARADIYALGILLNEMLTKQHPSRQLAEGKFRPIIDKCTRINAEQRYPSVSALLTALDTLPKRKRFFLWIPLLLVTVCVLLTSWVQQSAEPQDLSPSEPPQTVLTEPLITEPTTPSMPPIKAAKLTGRLVAENPWEGDPIANTTDFTCDLDGDGTEEFYRYGIRVENFDFGPNTAYDRCDSGPNCTHLRTVHACVWRIYEDGTWEPAREFADLLTDTELTVYRVDDLTSRNPTLRMEPNFWPGYTHVLFAPRQSGTWLYEVRSKFADQELSATYISIFNYIEE